MLNEKIFCIMCIAFLKGFVPFCVSVFYCQCLFVRVGSLKSENINIVAHILRHAINFRWLGTDVFNYFE